jgi:radical SAM superfamily enzyme YgiQ (UPF0313 family)
MKVLLVYSSTFSFSQLPRAVEGQRGLNPPISLAYIAAATRVHGFDVRILDMDAERITIPKLERYIKDYKPNVVGFSVNISNLLENLYYAKRIKEIDPAIIVVFGGILMDLSPEDTIRFPYVDAGVIGEGELTFPAMLEALEKNKPLDGVAGIIYKAGKKVIKTQPRAPIDDLDTIPFPARDLLHNEKYVSLVAKRTPITIFFSSRGCPFQCTFCSKPSFWNHWRFASPRYVVDEMENCLSLGINDFMVYDDVFTANRKRVIEICHEIKRRRLDVAWNIRTRVDLVDKPLLEILHKSGCYRVCYGVESGDPQMLKTYNKGTSISKIERAFTMTREAGIEILSYYMVGGPGETYRSIQRTFSLMHRLNSDYVHITHVVPYSHTKLFDMALERKVADPDIWRHLSALHYDTFPMFTDGELSREEIFKQVQAGYHGYYFRPSYIWRRLLTINTLSSLWRHTQAALSLILK